MQSIHLNATAPVGVFDSGIGGLSVLRHLRDLLPQQSFLYFADSAYAPYGEQTDALLVARSMVIADFLISRGARALVVSCNTATAAAIGALRQRYLDLPLVGIEPGLKPAALLSSSKIIGVLATRSTLASARFLALKEQIEQLHHVRFIGQACIGLADQIERQNNHRSDTAELVTRYVTPLIEQGADTLVLGCTHYPFVADLIERSALTAGAQAVRLVDTGAAVARQVQRVLQAASPGQALAITAESIPNAITASGELSAFASGQIAQLSQAFTNLLKLAVEVEQVVLKNTL